MLDSLRSQKGAIHPQTGFLSRLAICRLFKFTQL